MTKGKNVGVSLSPSVYSSIKSLMQKIQEGESVRQISNKNSESRSYTISYYLRKYYDSCNGDLLKCMGMVKEKLELKFSHLLQYAVTKDEKVKVQQRLERTINKEAQALAKLHEFRTGERVEHIPAPSDKSHYMQTSIVLDKGEIGKYWSNPVELAARAFEAYVSDKLVEKGWKNDYLVSGTNDPVAFPSGEERKKINECFDELINVIRKIQLLE